MKTVPACTLTDELAPLVHFFTDKDMSVDGFVYVTHPPGLFVHNNITALEQYADVDVNGTYSLQTRVAFIADIGDSLYELNF